MIYKLKYEHDLLYCNNLCMQKKTISLLLISRQRRRPLCINMAVWAQYLEFLLKFCFDLFIKFIALYQILVVIILSTVATVC